MAAEDDDFWIGEPREGNGHAGDVSPFAADKGDGSCNECVGRVFEVGDIVTKRTFRGLNIEKDNL